MTPLTLTTIYLLAICAIALIIWQVARISLHRQRVNHLSHEAEITVLGQKAFYCYRVGKYNHRIKLADDTTYIVDVDLISLSNYEKE
jgi:hypothetical protein